MVTLGALPNAPVAVTAVFAPAPLTLPPEADAEADADVEDDEEEALDFDDPQPARATQASRGMAMSARKRRMKKTLKGGGCQPRQPIGTAVRPRPSRRRLERTPRFALTSRR